MVGYLKHVNMILLYKYKLTLFIFTVFVSCSPTKPSTPISGPFRSYISLVRKCTKPTYPWHPKPSIVLEMELYNHTTEGPSLRGSFNVLNYTAGVKIKTKSMIWENNKWKMNFILVDNGCRGPLMSFWMLLFNVKFDAKKCAFVETCNVPFDITNTNKIHHMMMTTAEYGRVMFVNEMFIMGKQFKTFYCHEYETVIEPI